MAFHLLKMPLTEVERFAHTMVESKRTIKYCNVCHNLSAQNPCEICASDRRDRSTICVVAETKDLLAIEKTGEFKGLYHVLQGLISPLDGIGPDDIRVKELLVRTTDESIKEIILAINPSVEGEATSLYLNKILKPFGVKVTRIAFGLPMGGDLEYVDELTILKAIEGRCEF